MVIYPTLFRTILEPLIARMKDGSSMLNESSPKATAGEEVGAEYSSSEAGHDDIEGLFDDVEPLRREEEPAREEADEPVEDHDRLVRGWCRARGIEIR